MKGDVRWSCTAIPLTPIHVGDGTALSPEDWRLVDGALERFSPSAVLRSLGAAARQRYLAELDQGRLNEALRVLRDGVRPDHVIERVAASRTSAAELKQVVENPLRKGEVRPFVRSAGRPYIPGSSLKGAFRTAILSEMVEANGLDLARRMSELEGEKTGRRQDLLQRLVLDADKPDRDPLRFLRVADAELPENATRIDKVENWKPGNGKGSRVDDARGGIQMHFERLVSSADGRAARFTFDLVLEIGRLGAARLMDQAGERTPRRTLDEASFWKMVNDFHWRRFKHERERFFAHEAGTLNLLQRMTTLRGGGGEVREAELRRGYPYLLLRLGRFGQFESKSVDGYREGWNAQARRPMTEGNTRNVIRLKRARADGSIEEVSTPMGWLLVIATGRTA